MRRATRPTTIAATIQLLTSPFVITNTSPWATEAPEGCSPNMVSVVNHEQTEERQYYEHDEDRHDDVSRFR